MERLRPIVERYAAMSRDALPRALEERLRTHPRCPASRYLAGCLEFDRKRPATAVRHMMIAQHAEPHFQSAALLVFAGLNWVSQRSAPFLAVLLDTWEEFRRPQFYCYRKERFLLDRFAEPWPGGATGPALARSLWRLPIDALRSQIRDAVATRDPLSRYPLLAGPA
jgi:hypothetical protein